MSRTCLQFNIILTTISHGVFVTVLVEQIDTKLNSNISKRILGILAEVPNTM